MAAITVKFAAWIGLLCLCLAITAPLMLQNLNGHVDIELAEPSPVAKSLHRRLLIADLHADSLLWPRDLSVRSSSGHVDIPRLLEGNVSLQVFSVVTKVPKGQNYARNRGDTDLIELLAIASGWPVRTWSSPFERALFQAQRFDELVSAANGDLVPIRSKSDLQTFLARRKKQRGPVGGLLALEGAHVLEGDLDRLDALFEAGYRMAGLAHFFDNTLGGSSHGWDKGGLTDFGRAAVHRMEELGIIVDLAHVSARTIDDVLAMVKKPVVVSHTGVRGTCPSSRNLSDAQIDRIAASRGIIGIGYWSSAICSAEPAAVARAVRYVAKRVGLAHVGLGSDYDGLVSTAFDASELVHVTNALLQEGFSPAEVEAIMGGNVLRLLQDTLP